MPIPKLSHLQFLVLGFLISGTTRGKELRKALLGVGEDRSGPAFYQMMARLEDQGLIHGRYEQEIVDGQIIRERHYKPTGLGERAWRGNRDFYLQWIQQFGEGAAPA